MPISSNELRIGNIVLDPYNNERGVVGVHYEIVHLHRNGQIDAQYPASDLSHVPLTKDRLFSMGAKMFGDGVSLELNNRLIGYAECRGVFYDLPTNVDLISVHQYQNLIFALTGQELPVSKVL